MKNNNIPEFILCPTPELARQVLEKIERESDLKWHCDEKKPTEFTPKEYYPDMVISISGGKLMFASRGLEIKNGITNFTKAEDYLKENGLKEQCPNCLDRNDNIPDGLNGSCGVCGGKGFITWKETNIKINNYMTDKTWENLEVNDVLIDKRGNERFVLGICGKAIFVSSENVRSYYGGFTKEEFVEEGWKIKGAGEDKPSIDDVIEILDKAHYHACDSDAQEAIMPAIEMLKKLK